MQYDSDVPPLWLASADEIKDPQLRADMVRAVQRNWCRWVTYAQNRGVEAVDANAVLESAFDAVAKAHRAERVENAEGYLFKAFLRAARRLLRRARRVEYHDPDDLANLTATIDSDAARRLELQVETKELMNLMDDRMRMIFVMECQGFSRREIARVLGMSEDAVRKTFSRGIQKLRRLIGARS